MYRRFTDESANLFRAFRHLPELDVNSDGEDDNGEIDYPDTPESAIEAPADWFANSDGETVEPDLPRPRLIRQRGVARFDDSDNEEDLDFAEPDTAEAHAFTTPHQCGICCEVGELLMHSTLGRPVSVEDVHYYDLGPYLDSDPEAGRVLQPHIILIGPCYHPKHTFCVACLRRMATVETVRQGQGRWKCPGSCRDPEVRPTCQAAFNLCQLNGVIPVTTQSRLRQEARRHQVNPEFTGGAYAQAAWPSPAQIANPGHFPNQVLKRQVDLPTLQKQVNHILDSPDLPVVCKECGVALLKSVDCNAMRHCGVEVCYCCGRTAVQLPPEHFQSENYPDHCPRYLDQFQVAEFKCVAYVCHDSAKPCQDPAHQTGLSLVTDLRRQFHARALWQDLDLDQQAYILAVLQHQSPKRKTQWLQWVGLSGALIQ